MSDERGSMSEGEKAFLQSIQDAGAPMPEEYNDHPKYWAWYEKDGKYIVVCFCDEKNPCAFSRNHYPHGIFRFNGRFSGLPENIQKMILLKAKHNEQIRFW